MESKCPDKTFHMRGMNLNLCIVRMFEDTFSVSAAYSFYRISCRSLIVVLRYGADIGITLSSLQTNSNTVDSNTFANTLGLDISSGSTKFAIMLLTFD